MSARVDVLVIGGGSAGLAAALPIARAGLTVRVVERTSLDDAGARWSNGVPDWAFDAAHVARPQPPEGVPSPTMHLVAGWSGTRITVDDLRMYEVDMPRLQARLAGLAADAGAQLHGEVEVEDVHGDLDATDGDVVVHTSAGPVDTRWIVDASGLHGMPWSGQDRVERADLCVAAQEVRRCTDRQAALRWLDAQGAVEGEVVCFTGIAGGFSVVNVRVHGDEVGILTGSMPAHGHPSGPALLQRFVDQHHAWIGDKLSGGARAIPCAMPRRLHRGRIAFFGDSALQVYAAHGSGIAQQLASGPLLADALASGGGPARWSRMWWRRFGPDVTASWVAHRASRKLTLPALELAMRTGVMRPSTVKRMVEQRPFG